MLGSCWTHQHSFVDTQQLRLVWVPAASDTEHLCWPVGSVRSFGKQLDVWQPPRLPSVTSCERPAAVAGLDTFTRGQWISAGVLPSPAHSSPLAGLTSYPRVVSTDLFVLFCGMLCCCVLCCTGGGHDGHPQGFSAAGIHSRQCSAAADGSADLLHLGRCAGGYLL